MLGGRFFGNNKTRTGESFHGVRPIQPQDPVKYIHWASSSKGQGLMVKEFSQELSGRTSVILECHEGDNVNNKAVFDDAARAAGSLALAALDTGYQVEFAFIGSSDVIAMSPFIDGGILLEALAYISPNTQGATEQQIANLIEILSPKSGLNLVFTALPGQKEKLINHYLSNLNRKISIYVPESWDFDNVSKSSTLNIKYYASNQISESA